jgi:SEC-C motif
MPGVPAQCAHCGLRFEGQGIHIGGDVKGLVLQGNTEPCPRCGAPTEIIEGEFNVQNDLFEALRSTELDRDLLARLALLGEQVEAGAIAVEEAEPELAKASPAFASLLARAPASVRKAIVATLLQVIVILAAQGVAELRDDSVTTSELEGALHRQEMSLEKQIEQAVDRAFVDHAPKAGTKPSQGSIPEGHPKTLRNAPCPCGSGIKYKKCCGQ